MKRTILLTLPLLLLSAPGQTNPVLINLSADTWYEAPNTRLSDAMASPDPSIITAWSGAAYDPVGRRLLLTGGGMGNYKGNEIYAFSIDSLKWSRLTEPCAQYVTCDPTPCGSPIVRHTYNGLEFITHANRFFIHDGAWNAATYPSCPAGSITGTQCGMRQTHALNMAALTWELKALRAGNPTGGCESNHAYDPVSGLIFYSNVNDGLWKYDYDNDLWTHLNNDRCYAQTSTIDAKRGLYIRLGHEAGNWDKDVTVYDIRSSGYPKAQWSTTGGGEILKKASPGVSYDPVSDKIVCWAGGPVYSLDPDTKIWSAHSGSGAPAATSNGMYGRWRYAPSENVLICVTSIDENVHFYKFTAGGPPSTGIKNATPVAARAPAIAVTPSPVSGRAFIFTGASVVRAEVFGIDGRRTDVLNVGTGNPLHWDAKGLPGGLYLIKISAGGHTLVKSVLVVH